MNANQFTCQHLKLSSIAHHLVETIKKDVRSFVHKAEFAEKMTVLFRFGSENITAQGG